MAKSGAVLFVLLLSLMIGSSGHALSASSPETHAMIDLVSLQKNLISASLEGALDWHVGDRAEYQLNAPIGRGTSVQFVREDVGTGFWMQTDVDMGFLGRQKIEVLANKATGRIERVLVNGNEQTPPDPNDVEIIDTREERVRVPAGEFQSTYRKIKNKKDNSIQEGWSNPQMVPMGGMLKAMGNTQIGTVTQLLTRFSFGQGS